MKASRRKSARNPVEAAGGIVMRPGRSPLFAVVQRRKDNRWMLPKGKLKPREHAIAAARREAIEETGHNVSVHEYLGAVSYETGNRAKIVGFWRMEEISGPERERAPDIKAVEWLPLDAAVSRLTQPLERAFLAQIGERAIKAMRQTRERTPRKLARRKMIRRKPVNGAGDHLTESAIALNPAPKRNLFQRLFGKQANDDTRA